jgi:hypothetical protein
LAIEAFVFSLLSDAFFPIALTVAYAILVQPHLEPLLSQALREHANRVSIRAPVANEDIKHRQSVARSRKGKAVHGGVFLSLCCVDGHWQYQT